MKLAAAHKMIEDAYRIAIILLALVAFLFAVCLFLFVGSEELRRQCDLSALYETLKTNLFYAFDI